MASKQWNTPPNMQIDVDKTYLATLDTDRGVIELELYPQYAPKTVNNFAFLAGEGLSASRIAGSSGKPVYAPVSGLAIPGRSV